jgi:succinate dehydrogenase / fumarate reductase membrane anchor subunit
MTTRVKFDSGRNGKGAAYASDHSASAHAKFMRLSAKALLPLGLFAVWTLVGIVGKSYDAARADLGRPFVAATLIAFIWIASLHARQGACEIIEDYVHDEPLKQKALLANKWLSLGFAAAWTLALAIIVATH